MTKKVKDINKVFQTFSENFRNKRLQKKMLDVCDEHPNYVADELLLLSEEILSQVSAYGVSLYLQFAGNLQTEKNNDYILHNLFLHEGHQNAGPIFYSVRNIVQEMSAVLSDKQNELFSSESEINKKFQDLASFRNSLMHGFFKLPAERNLGLVEEIHAVLDKVLNNHGIFNHKADFHFWKKEGFSGHWFITDDTGWVKLAGKNVTLFERLASRAKVELHSDTFLNTVSLSRETTSEFEYKGKVEGFVTEKRSTDFKESLYVQFHPYDKKHQDEFYLKVYKLLNERPELKIISYSIDSEGISFTSYLLFQIICRELGTPFPKKEIKDKIRKEVKKQKKKLLILINHIHLVPFASDHITSLIKFFNESGIYFIGIGWEYEHLNSVFSQKLNLRKDQNIVPDEIEIQQIIKNYTRHRGPFEKDSDFADLKHIIHLICQRLKDKKSVIARQLADEEKMDIELINEALYILYPYFKYNQNGDETMYKKDDLDELYGFPKTQTETSSIFLTLGRRDIDLEYKHKILMP